MQPRTSPERWLWAAYALAGALVVILGVLGVSALRTTITTKDEVIFEYGEDVLAIERLRLATELEDRRARSYLLTRNDAFFTGLGAVQENVDRRFQKLRDYITEPETERLLEHVFDLEKQHRNALRGAVNMRQRGASLQVVTEFFEDDVQPLREKLDTAFDALREHEQTKLDVAKRVSAQKAASIFKLLMGTGVAAVLVAGALGILLLRALRALAAQRRVLEKNLERLAEANKDLEAFAGRIAHDLRNVLAPLTLHLGRIRLETDDEAVLVATQRIQRSVGRAIDMMDTLLAFSRAGQPADLYATAGVTAVADDVVEDLRALTSSVGASMDFDLPPQLAVQCSPGLLHAVLANLTSNAVKFLEGRPERRVKVSAHHDGRWCVLVVEDTGPGIPASALQRVFEPFYRIPGSRAPGTGIGLATVQRIVQSHGGRVAVQSEVDKGTTFRVWLPLASDLRDATPRGQDATTEEAFHS